MTIDVGNQKVISRAKALSVNIGRSRSINFNTLTSPARLVGNGGNND
jgi:hypothetical protein